MEGGGGRSVCQRYPSDVCSRTGIVISRPTLFRCCFGDLWTMSDHDGSAGWHRQRARTPDVSDTVCPVYDEVLYPGVRLPGFVRQEADEPWGESEAIVVMECMDLEAEALELV